ncbi:hypothetical protein FKW77_007250 [Venturia effusa]|uniref:Uncharacterized protein n=1 Tax=Venturia effusa TaxID=50376 RepID=A0A517KWS0_9PEZI|nr:hypothetical protein FKW77_007250 [Venturia effusa]
MAFRRNPKQRSPGQSYTPSRSPAPATRPRPYSQALDAVVKKDFPSAPTFEERVDLLISEYKRNYQFQPGRDPSLESTSAASNTGCLPRPPSHANSASLQLNSAPHSSHANGSNSIQFVDNDPNRKKRKRRNYTDDEKAAVARTRKVGACKKCNQSHKKCTHVAAKQSPGFYLAEAAAPENVGTNVDFSLQGINLAAPENHTQTSHAPTRTPDSGDHPTKAGQPIYDPRMDLDYGSLQSNIPTFLFNFTPEVNFSSSQGQKLPPKGPQTEPLGYHRINLPQEPSHMAWDSETIFNPNHCPHDTYSHGDTPSTAGRGPVHKEPLWHFPSSDTK